MGINQAFASYGNPKENAETERVFRTMKEELLWLREWHSPFELTEVLARWVEDYNRSYLHSSLGYKSPMKFEEEYQNTQPTLFVNADLTPELAVPRTRVPRLFQHTPSGYFLSMSCVA